MRRNTRVFEKKLSLEPMNQISRVHQDRNSQHQDILRKCGRSWYDKAVEGGRTAVSCGLDDQGRTEEPNAIKIFDRSLGYFASNLNTVSNPKM